MSQVHPQCVRLQEQVNRLLQLFHQEEELRTLQDTSAIEASLKKAISPNFEIVFAGAFSAGKSMLINALLERELLYSAEGHATGTECTIEYADSGQERVVLTFLSEAEIREQVKILCDRLLLNSTVNINQPESIDQLTQDCRTIIQQEGGASKSERAKQANALILLLDGYLENRDRIQTVQNATYSMDQLGFDNLTKAADYARRGSNSSVLKKLQYYCAHPLLEDGNVLVDVPGIDAPVKKDAALTYSKIEHPDTSAVVTVLKPAAAGDMTSEETSLLEKMKNNPGIRDRVFYVFNRIDETWYNAQLRQRLERLIQSEFRDTKRIYKTSGLLGFYGSQVKHTQSSDRYGLESLFAESVKGLGGEEETPQFVSAFNNYCANSGKLIGTTFGVSVYGYETPNENYVRILSEWGTPLIEQLIQDSGVEEFRNAITRYLTEEKRPQLYANLADDLQPLCIALRKYYLAHRQVLASEPYELDAMKARELERLNQQLQEIGQDFQEYMEAEINRVINNKDEQFEADFNQLKLKMVNRLDELLKAFSVADTYERATMSHPRNATAPFLAILVEAIYYIANQLEDVLVDYSRTIAQAFSQRLAERLQQTDHYKRLYRLLRGDGGIEEKIQGLENRLTIALVSAARKECDRYVRESPRFYDEGTFSVYQFRQTLQQTSQSYGAESIIEAEPAIRQLLKLDFEPKVSATIRRNFRQEVNQAIKTESLPMAEKHADDILQQYDRARANLEQSLQREAEEKIAKNRQLQDDIEGSIEQYNESIQGINSCLEAMMLYEKQLPIIGENDFAPVGVVDAEVEELDVEEEGDTEDEME
ncbi:dynamin-like GTPase family protein [Spirulina sp. CS-785/01]|uniref:dynamin-like GTPase family protein n=1 Tax=Spirulina sp. CS-785/01 TaxID=3021716 RepID=UPI00232F7969|nr:dynamin-like GTPase family protein [Spirulina sp. CS-785/01]MDB9313419.1 dynamin-like GTPase family protein [Spirulina sp. CS-785/01]